jgi:hypothetical protein
MPGKNVGTLSMADLLAVRFLTAVKFGLDIIQAALERDRQIHVALMTDMVKTYAQPSTDVHRLYGVGATIRGSKVDEFGRAHTQKNVTGSAVGFPLNRFQYATGWTADYLENKTPADLAETQLATETGNALDVRSELQAAIYGATNYTFIDYLTNRFSIDVKRFVNADGADIPVGPNGETFDASTHTHYLAGAALTNTLAHNLVDTVVEHHQDGQPQIFINTADEAAWRGLTDFKPYVDSRLTLGISASEPTARLNPFRTNNRPIGLFGAAEVWVKPWAIAGYAVCMDVSPAADKPLVLRVRTGDTISLKPAAQIVMFPLQAEYMNSEFGFGVWTRTNGAVLDFGHASYTVPAAL